tara:strand:+ start:1112 stop:1432 length:321 start_codon:yes stop_codon:yes gene_type:complete
VGLEFDDILQFISGAQSPNPQRVINFYKITLTIPGFDWGRIEPTPIPHDFKDLRSTDGLRTEKLAPERHEFALSDCVTDARLTNFGLTVISIGYCTISDIMFRRTI